MDPQKAMPDRHVALVEPLLVNKLPSNSKFFRNALYMLVGMGVAVLFSSVRVAPGGGQQWVPIRKPTIAMATMTSTGVQRQGVFSRKQAFLRQSQQRPMMTARAASLAEPPVAVKESPPPPSPLTIWGEKIADIRAAQAEARSKPPAEFPKTIRKTDVLPADADKNDEVAWFSANAQEVKDDMERNGAVVFRGFTLMKTQPGFEAFYQAIGMNPCQDPLISVAARPTADGDKNSAVYEAVNKESRKNFFIGMHNEFVGTRAPRAAAFVSFKPAEQGGEFIIADGRAVFRDLDSDLLERIYQRSIRYSVMELPFFGWVDKLPEVMQSPAMSVIKSLASLAFNAKVDFDIELLEQRGGYDNTRLLQARAPSQAPIVRHPVTGEPTWFCNVHSHSAKLRKAREDTYGKEKFEDGASTINKSDMFYGDDGELSEADLKHLDEVTKKHMHYIKMDAGDVVLLDNYKTMHGRNVFEGTRKHAVAWFGGWDGEDQQRSRQWNV